MVSNNQELERQKSLAVFPCETNSSISLEWKSIHMLSIDNKDSAQHSGFRAPLECQSNLGEVRDSGLKQMEPGVPVSYKLQQSLMLAINYH